MEQEKARHVFAMNLKRLIERTGKSQREMADIAGVSAPTLNQWLSEKKYPRIDKVQRIADHFGLLRTDLIEDMDEKEKRDEEIQRITYYLKTNDRFRKMADGITKMSDEEFEKIYQIYSVLQNN